MDCVWLAIGRVLGWPKSWHYEDRRLFWSVIGAVLTVTIVYQALRAFGVVHSQGDAG